MLENSRKTLLRFRFISKKTTDINNNPPESYKVGKNSQTFDVSRQSFDSDLNSDDDNKLKFLQEKEKDVISLAQSHENTCQKTKIKSPKNKKLLNYDQIPEWMQENIYIRNYYLPPCNSTIKCIKNIFTIHNEFGNIWTHFLPSLVFIYSLVQLYFGSSSNSNNNNNFFLNNFEEKLVLGFWKICAVFCFSASWLYHSHKNHRNLYQCCLTADISGIVCMITGSCFVWEYYYLFCWKNLQIFYMAFGLILGLILIIGNILKIFQDYRILNMVLLMLLAVSALIPFFHIMIFKFESKNFSKSWELGQMWSVLGMAVSYNVGALIYAVRFPEKIWPGKFDIWLHSHQIFHIFVVFGAFFHWDAVEKMQERQARMGMMNICRF